MVIFILKNAKMYYIILFKRKYFFFVYEKKKIIKTCRKLVHHVLCLQLMIYSFFFFLSFSIEVQVYIYFDLCLTTCLPIYLSSKLDILNLLILIIFISFHCFRSVRIERLGDKTFEHSSALSNMTSFISSQADTQENLQMLLSLPSLVISCLSALKIYLTDFKVENILKDIKYVKFYWLCIFKLYSNKVILVLKQYLILLFFFFLYII